MKRNNKQGFTIVELVIVIAVIAILAGVLIPTFSSIVTKADASKALQEARNAYTNFLIDHPEADYDYIQTSDDDEAIIYHLKNDFAVVEADEITDGAKVWIVGGSCEDTSCEVCTEQSAGT